MSVFWDPSVGCAAGIAFLTVLVCTGDERKNGLDRLIEFLSFMAAAFVIFGYRANAITVLPVILVMIFLEKRGTARKIRALAAVFLGGVMVWLLPAAFHVSSMPSWSAGMGWEMFLTIRDMDAEKQEQYLDYLDDVGGEGSTRATVETVSDDTVDFLWSDTGFDQDALSEEGNGDILLNRYVRLFLDEPADCLRTRLRLMKRTLGIGIPVTNAEYDYNRDNKMGEYRFNDCMLRRLFVDGYNRFMEKAVPLRMPWLVFFGTFLLLIWKWKRSPRHRRLYGYLFLLAIFYYGAFLVNTQSFEARYFFPSLYLMVLTDTAILMDLIRHGLALLSKRKEAPA